MAEKHGREEAVDVKESVIRVVRPCPDRSEQERFLDAVHAAVAVGEEYVDEQRSVLMPVFISDVPLNFERIEAMNGYVYKQINTRQDLIDISRFIHDEHLRVEQLQAPSAEVHGVRHTGGLNWLSGQGSVVRLGDEIMSMDDFHLIYGVAPLAYYPPNGPLGWNLCAWWGYECCLEGGVADMFVIPPQHKHPSYNPAKWSDLDRMCITPMWQVEEQAAPLNQMERFERNETTLYRKGAKDAQFAYAHYVNAPVMNPYVPGGVKLDMNAWQFDQRRRRVYRRMYYALPDIPIEDATVRVVTFEPIEEEPENWNYRAVPACCKGYCEGLRHVHQPCCQPHFSRFLFGCARPLIRNLQLFEIIARDFHHRQGGMLYSCNEILMEVLMTFMASRGSDVLEVIASYFRKEELELLALPLRYFMSCTQNCSRNFGDMLIQCRLSRDFSPACMILSRYSRKRDLKVMTSIGLTPVESADCEGDEEEKRFRFVYINTMAAGPKIYDRYPRWRVAVLSGILNDMNEKRERDMKLLSRGFEALRARLDHALFVLDNTPYTRIEKTVVDSFPFESRLIGKKGPEPLKRRSVMQAAAAQEEHEFNHKKLLRAWKFIFDLHNDYGRGREALAWQWLSKNRFKGAPVHSNDKVFLSQLVTILADLIHVRLVGSERKSIQNIKNIPPVYLEGFDAMVFSGAVHSTTYEFGPGELSCPCYKEVGITQGEIQALSWRSDACCAEFNRLLDPSQRIHVRGIFDPKRHKLEEGEITGDDRSREAFSYMKKDLLSPWKKKPVDLTEDDDNKSDASTVVLAQEPIEWGTAENLCGEFLFGSPQEPTELGAGEVVESRLERLIGNGEGITRKDPQ